MSKYEVDFCGRPVWWPFIMAFRYAINRPNALHDIEDWLLVNFPIIDHKATFLNQMIQDASQAVALDCRELNSGKTAVLIYEDVATKIRFINKVIKLAKENNIALGGYSKPCLENAKETAIWAEVLWDDETEAVEE